MADLLQPTAKRNDSDSPDFSSEKKLTASMDADYLDSDVDSIHDGLLFPTAEEMLTLRRVSDAIPWNAYREYLAHMCLIEADFHFVVIAIVELAERFSVSLSYRPKS
jgi:POT family proton-dependent oligopeptide transporter